MNGLDLFSGIGGIAQALAPWVRTVAYCERERYAQAVLLSRMERGEIDCAPIWDDVTTLRGDMLPRIDIITGGFPCQDLSLAGNRAGLAGERSGLFFQIIRLVRELQPSFIFMENVPGIFAGDALGTVNGELAALGYDCRWGSLPAYAVGAHIERTRWFALACSNGKRFPGGALQGSRREIGPRREKQSAGLFETEIQLEKTASELAGKTNGIPYIDNRNHALGNGVVPQQVAEAFQRLAGLKLP